MAKKSTRREWTKEDVRELKTLARQKTPVAKIAKSLKRTPGATQQKAFTLGVSLDPRDWRHCAHPAHRVVLIDKILLFEDDQLS